MDHPVKYPSIVRPLAFLKFRLPHLLPDFWTIAILTIALLIATPLFFILSSLFADSREVWHHLATTVLPGYILNSIWLMVGVGVGTLVLGTGTAWFVTMTRFPGRWLFEWALLLPLAAPAYLLAYTYTELLEFYGPVQTSLREVFGWTSVQDYWFPNIRSVGGAIVMLTLVLYPYVYLLARSAFLSQSACTLEACRNLGCTPWRSFWTVALPLARPAMMAGLALVLMETLNDYGTVQHFAVDTFTTGIYRTWFGMGERAAAEQLAALLMLFVLSLILVERWSRHQAQYYQTNNRFQRPAGYHLGGFASLGAIVACTLPVAFGFLIPGGALLQMALGDMQQTLASRFWGFATNSLILSGITALLAVVIALLMAYGLRLRPHFWMRFSSQVAAMGYAIPGSVIAVSILIPVGKLDNGLDRWMQDHFNVSTGLLLSGTIVALILAYLIRFLAVSFSTVDASLTKIRPNLDDAARSLGHSPMSTLFRVHAPMMGGGLLTAVLLVFVDVMKELPATLIIRPFNFETLAVRVYQLASDERLVEAAAPALAIVVVGLIPVLLLSWQISQTSVQEKGS
ncbi:MAG: iron ABC transporter permease [Leptolyngbyaceae cyanobacterium bins.59]|nr:iron ABC transporter permease [Leptolyngbyaceae cyanobacterium bins.59]